MVELHEGVARNGDIEIFTTLASPPSSPSGAMLLVNGMGSTSVTWSRALVDPLLEAGIAVVRFDLRDVGRSTRLPSMTPYTLADLAADAIAVLDHWELSAAHVLGRSMGGSVCIEAALAAPERVTTLTLAYSSAALMPSDDGLPPPEDWVIDAAAEALFAPPPASDGERIERIVAESQRYAGTRHPFDVEAARAEAAAEVAHAPHGDHGHGVAVLSSPSRVGDLARIAVPTLVLHGTADPVVPIAHGRLLAARIPRARLVEFEGLGHEMPAAWCREIAPEVLRHIGAHRAAS